MAGTDLLLDMADYIVSKGLGIGDGIDIFRNHFPETPNDVIVLFEYPGITTDVDAVGRNVQISARAEDYELARGRINALFRIFDLPANRIMDSQPDSGRWWVARAKQTPFKLDVQGALNCPVFAFNLHVITYRD